MGFQLLHLLNQVLVHQGLVFDQELGALALAWTFGIVGIAYGQALEDRQYNSDEIEYLYNKFFHLNKTKPGFWYLQLA